MVILWMKQKNLVIVHSSPASSTGLKQCSVVLVLIQIFSWFAMSAAAASDELLSEDTLTPYQTHHGPLHRTHRDTQTCQSVRYGNVTHTKHQARTDASIQLPLVESYFMIKEVGTYSWDKKLAYVNHQIVNNPLTTWSVLEPGHSGACQNGTSERATVKESSLQRNCLVATNAGFFNTHTGQCLGNIVSDGILVQDSGGVQNVHFGITKDGYIFTGYLSEIDLLVQDFTQLVGGVVWLVRDGENYVDESKSIECPETEETGTVERFISAVSARVAVGHDSEGRIHMVQVNGKTDVSGVDLYQFANLLIELGLLNAINLDGGGSATTVINGTVVGFPSDQCANSSYNCARKVSTILCVHQPSCSSPDCSGHGSCELGVCQCQGHWTGSSCNRLECPGDCSQHGQCTQDGCQCSPGWKGENCSSPCIEGQYGINCSVPCACAAGVGATCNPVTGECKCSPGYSGKYCQSVCPFGYFGQDCLEVCDCVDSCFCDPVTGSCNVSVADSDVFEVGLCLARQEIRQKHLTPDKTEQYNFCVAIVLGFTIVITVSLFANVLLAALFLRTRCNQKKFLRRQIRLALKHAVLRMTSMHADSENDDEDDSVAGGNDTRTTEIIEIEKGENGNVTGSGEDEEDLFLAPQRNIRGGKNGRVE